MNYSSLLKSRFVKIFAAVLIGGACVYTVARSFDWRQIGASLEKADLVLFFSCAIATQFVFFFFRALRWNRLLRAENSGVPFGKLYLYNSVSIGVSNITPFQSGEAVKVELLRKYGVGRAAGYTIFFIEKVLDFAVVVAMGVAGVSLGFDSGVPRVYIYVVAIVLAAGFAAALAVGFRLPFERLNPVKDLLRERWRQKEALLAAVFFTVCSWSAAILGWKMTLRSVSIDIDFLQSMSLVSLTVLLTIVSFVPGAVGVSELGITAILTRMNVDSAAAQTGAIALRAYALTLLVLAFLHWIALKVSTRNAD